MSRLAPPPSSPNCVSSRAEPKDKVHYIKPLQGVTIAQIRDVVSKMPRMVLKKDEDGYLHFVATTRLFRFKDDLEFELDGDTVHVRSASRVGYGDLGANRSRVESIRAALAGA